MSSKKAISVKNVDKTYRIFNKPQDRFKQMIWGNKRKYYKEYFALTDISFEVLPGESIGIIGRNGSGKSTILQIIAKTLQPTQGEVNVQGRVAALLELGSGFNPDFTGRENVLMNCSILGLTPQEIHHRMPEIEGFADIGDFIDQPVKTYSSGMFVRLAFACAINVDPDILIIDEALAVGDMNFQLKCMNKLKSFKEQGKTILFVSHDTYSVRNFCDQAIWMMDGQIYKRGDARVVVEEYQDFMKSIDEDSISITVESSVTDSNQAILTIDNIHFLSNTGLVCDQFRFGETFSIKVEYTIHRELEGIVGGIAIYDKLNNYICGLNTKLDRVELPESPGNYSLVLEYTEMRLLPGTYFIDVGFFESSAVINLDYKNRMKSFRIISGDYFAEGLLFINHNWKLKE